MLTKAELENGNFIEYDDIEKCVVVGDIEIGLGFNELGELKDMVRVLNIAIKDKED